MTEARRPLSTTLPRSSGKRRILLALVVLSGLVAAPGAVRAQLTGAPRVVDASFVLPDGAEITYAVALPAGYDTAPEMPRPLVLSLHPGGRGRHYGRTFMQQIIEPGLRRWGAIIVAPDVPDRSWATGVSSRAVRALLEHVLAAHAIDRERILVTGYSMGGRGAWFLASRHPDLFTGAIPMAGAPGSGRLDSVSSMPVLAIHSADDEVVPYDPAAKAIERLEAMGAPARLDRLDGVSHFEMGAFIEPLQAAGEWIWEQWERRAGAAK